MYGDNEKYLQQLDDQWRKLPFVQFSSNINTEIEPDKFLAKLTKFKDSDSDELEYYVLISSFALKVLSLPHSNADCEWLFSKINREKTKSRNRLITKTVAATVLTSELISNSSTKGTCVTFKPENTMLSRMTSSKLYPNTNTISIDDNLKF